jgi:hypothetical protein
LSRRLRPTSGRIPDRVGDLQVCPTLVEQVHGERVEAREPRDELGNLLEQLVEVEDGSDLAAQLEQGHEQLCGLVHTGLAAVRGLDWFAHRVEEGDGRRSGSAAAAGLYWSLLRPCSAHFCPVPGDP